MDVTIESSPVACALRRLRSAVDAELNELSFDDAQELLEELRLDLTERIDDLNSGDIDEPTTLPLMRCD